MAALEPILDFRVYDSKSFWHRNQIGAIVLLIASPVTLFAETIKRVINIARGLQKLRPENLLPFIQLVVIQLIIRITSADSSVGAASDWSMAFKLWFIIQSTFSILFVVMSLMLAHHHPDMFHAGDGQFRYGLDWGLAQLDATGDSKDVTGSLFFELTFFGNHVLHHLFPALDHGILDYLRPILRQTCADFHLPDQVVQSINKNYDQKDLLLGTLRQLARTKSR